MTKRTAPKVTRQTSIGSDVDLSLRAQLDREGHRVDGAYIEPLLAASRKPGRPSLAASGPSPSIAFRVPAAVREQALAVPAQKGKFVSQLAREALDARLAVS